MEIIPSGELTYPTWGKGKSSSKVPFWGDMLVPRRVMSIYKDPYQPTRIQWKVGFLFSCLNGSLPTTCTGDAKERPGSLKKQHPLTLRSETRTVSHRVHGTGIFTYICHRNQPNVGKYIIHGSYGYDDMIQFLFLIRSIVITQSRNPLFFCPIQDFLLTKNTFVFSYVLWDDLLDNLLCPVISLEATDPSSEIYVFTRIHPYHSSGYVPTWIVEFLWDQSR